MPEKKRQVVLLVEPAIAVNADALRIITRESRARVLEKGLAHAIDIQVRQEADGMRRVGNLAERAGVDVAEYVAAYSVAYARATYGPGLDALEQDDSHIRKLIKKRKAARAA